MDTDPTTVGPSPTPGFKSGFVAIVGKPNVGKSTLLNTLLERKIAITSSKPQTTRTRVLGILTRPNAQVIFIDTPGWHKPKDELGRYMLGTTRGAIEEADVTVAVIDATTGITKEDEWVFEVIRPARGKALSAVNKMDAVKKGLALPLIEQLDAHKLFAEHVPISAKSGDNLPVLVDRIIHYLPEGPRWYEAEQVTDQTTEQIVREFIREEALGATWEEVPHALAVGIEEITPKEKVVFIRATIFVEREGQKAIIIGKGGQMLKQIGQQARLELERWMGRKIFLELWVKVSKDWRTDPSMLRQLGYEG